MATREMLSKNVLRRRLLLVLFGLGTNMGIKRVAVTGKHGESEATLRRVRHLFVNRANMRAALRKLVNATFAVRDEMWWGTGTACASDSRKFGAWSSNLMTEWHQRYRGLSRHHQQDRPASRATSARPREATIPAVARTAIRPGPQDPRLLGAVFVVRVLDA
ncbi:hypothetical protein BU52_32205 [Streptomyces toyocaensis]|uniref:Tn3 transposase DDE domain-containing protein n=1 Tax=Streptomyces toyocaensis TaxID=55952 RepID=A0A081XHU4_STRTO|nr:hypothetical protein BU52_32205 [Streptomyces toyocaensis]